MKSGGARAKAAMEAMKRMGFRSSKAMPLLKKLLKTCENNWEPIESENYSMLIDALLSEDDHEAKEPGKTIMNSECDRDNKKREATVEEESESYRKKLRQRQEDDNASPPSVLAPLSSSPKTPKSERNAFQKINTPCKNPWDTRGHMSASTSYLQEDMEHASHDGGERGLALGSPDRGERTECLKEPKIEPGLSLLPEESVKINKHEPIMCQPLDVEFPVLMIRPPHAVPSTEEGQSSKSSVGHGQMRSLAENAEEDNDEQGLAEVTNFGEPAINTEIASSTIGEKKVSLVYNVSDFPDFHMPRMESVLKRVEDRCLRSSQSFSLMHIMKEVCNSLLELGTNPDADKQEEPVKIIPLLDSLKASEIRKKFGNDADYRHKGKATEGATSKLALVCRHEPAFGGARPVHDVDDISKGEERARVPIINEFPGDRCPPHFTYIPHNLIYQNAYLNFSLARIGDEDYCADCFGDCLLASIPCACARETGGEFAYTPSGLLRKEFLDECISMRHDPPRNRMVYCKDCPLERAKDDTCPDECKGHLVRKFIKECWRKCGCSKQCGNRVVQLGIWCNLQVFWTASGKGWGLRSTDDLPRGAFVCEYVGEVLTNMELYERTLKTTGNARHTYPVLLDADWGSEGVLKDEEALCLDGTFYGNIARFINHRCYDANLVEVPVEVETPDRHYYHVAFFTSRKIDAFEELTWDYGIDFEDRDHPIKAFQCICGSAGCRDKSNPRGKRSAGIRIA